MNAINNISIRNKLIIIQSVTAFIALLICCSIFAFIGIRSFETAAVRKTYSIARILGANSVSPLQFLDQEVANKILDKLNNETDIQEAVLFDRNGRVFSMYSRIPKATVDTNLLHAREGLNYKRDFGIADPNFLVRYKITQANELLGTLFIKVKLTSLSNIIVSYLIASGLVLFAGLISALVASFFLQRTISHRLLLLVDKTKEVAQTGNYSHPVVYEGHDEIAILSKEFNNMLVQIDTMKSSLNEINQGLEERVAERTMELETANKEMEAFSYTVSHDLKAPLRAINGFTDILVSKYNDKLDDKGRELTRVIVSNAKKMGGLIEDLLEFSRIGRKELVMTDVSMGEAVEQVLGEARSLYSNRNEEVTVGLLPNAKGDKSLLIQVWANLIFNAFKYTGHKELTKIDIGSYQESDQTVYFIKDNGAGFDMKYEDKLFKVFQRLHGANEFEGTGVGLANVHRIVTRHGGKVWATGEVDKGASFYFSLPT
jgi:signal transduction histidine kinase